MFWLSSGILFLGLVFVFFSFFLSLNRFLNCLIIIENLNILLLFYCLFNQSAEARTLFLTLLVIFTIEVTLGLVVLTSLWRSSSLGYSAGL